MENIKDVSLSTVSKKKSYIKFYPEKWIFGSTREELTNAERAVWMDFLSLAAINDPVGYVDFISYKRLANKLNLSLRLLRSTVEKALAYGKVELEETRVGPEEDGKIEKNDSTCDQPGSKVIHFDPNRSKIGLVLRRIKILKWNEYQSEYMRQKPYRKKDGDKDGENGGLQNPGSKAVTQVTDREDEIRGNEIKLDESISHDQNSPTSHLNSSSKEFSETKKEFLLLLRSCSNYPFNESSDTALYEVVVLKHPNIDVIYQLKKKIDWWNIKASPSAVKSKPRSQLLDHFEKSFSKKKGAEKIGDIAKNFIQSEEMRDRISWLESEIRNKEKKT